MQAAICPAVYFNIEKVMHISAILLWGHICLELLLLLIHSWRYFTQPVPEACHGDESLIRNPLISTLGIVLPRTIETLTLKSASILECSSRVVLSLATPLRALIRRRCEPFSAYTMVSHPLMHEGLPEAADRYTLGAQTRHASRLGLEASIS